MQSALATIDHHVGFFGIMTNQIILDGPGNQTGDPHSIGSFDSISAKRMFPLLVLALRRFDEPVAFRTPSFARVLSARRLYRAVFNALRYCTASATCVT